ncbi:hypothetical protein [Ensifer sp. BR816]|uniref:hypothetical protein n=1 Tax=Rhizobium sp. (strain BR816) TaxID=1057002 RepID=UPI0003795975|nr:hypothetical protein [Ensifer sp. BR816]
MYVLDRSLRIARSDSYLVPIGYSFNLDGTYICMTLAALLNQAEIARMFARAKLIAFRVRGREHPLRAPRPIG